MACGKAGRWGAAAAVAVLAAMAAGGGPARAQVPGANGGAAPEPASANGGHGAAGAPAGGASAAPEAALAAGSPRASVGEYLDLCRRGDWAGASAFLDVPPSREDEAAELARRLKAVLDRHGSLDLKGLSPEGEGDAADGLPAGVDEVARVPGPSGAPEPVRIARSVGGEEARWRFARRTVARVDAWYEALDNRWMYENLPDWLLRPAVAGFLRWQLAVVPLLLALAVFLAFPLGGLTKRLMHRVASRTAVTWDDALVERAGGPLRMAWTLALASASLPVLGLSDPAFDLSWKVLVALAWVNAFWAVLRGLDVLGEALRASGWAETSPSSRFLVSFGIRVAKVVVAGIAVTAALSALGYPVASLVAGLGIGGLAFALAAQKTVENLFGAFAIGVDRPIRVGDFVKVEDVQGTVEAIGLRSTRIRTLERTLVSIPNGKLADMRLETFAARDRIRLATVLGLRYGTTAAQVRQVIAGVEALLRAHPRIWPDTVVVRLQQFAPSSLDVEVMAWFQTTDFNEFRDIRQDVLLAILEVVEGAGTSFAFPTRTVHLVKGAEV